MTAKQEQQASLMGTLQSEVATEASPLMLFLIRNARIIAVLFILFIAAIVAFWIYSSRAESVHKEDLLSLGNILVIQDNAERLQKLEAFAATTTGPVQHSAWVAILDAAKQLKDQDKAYTAWKHIAAFDENARATAALGMATALAEQGKFAEAVAELEKALPGLGAEDTANINVRIGYLAELAGDYPRALAAADAILAAPGSLQDVNFWKQKKIILARTIEEAKNASATTKPE